MPTIFSWEFAGKGRGVAGGAAASDTVAPTLVSATVENATPGQIDLVFSEAMNSTWSASSAFAVSAGHTLTGITRTGATTGYLTTSTDFVNGEAARTLAYTQPGSNKMQDLAGNLLANFSGTSITNNVLAAGSGAAPSSPMFTAEGTSGSGQVTLNWLLPETLMDGTDVSTYPLTSLTIYHNTTADGAAPGQSGVTTISGITATDVSRVVSFAAATRYFAISATNANGEGSLSPAVKGIST